MEPINMCIDIFVLLFRAFRVFEIENIVTTLLVSKIAQEEQIAEIINKCLNIRREYPDGIPEQVLHYTHPNTEFCCHFGRFQEDKQNISINRTSLKFILKKPSKRIHCNMEVCTGCAFRAYIEFRENTIMENQQLKIIPMKCESPIVVNIPIVEKSFQKHVIVCKGWDFEYLYLETPRGSPLFVRIYRNYMNTDVDKAKRRGSKIIISDFEPYQYEYKRIDDYWENGVKNLHYDYCLESIHDLYMYEVDGEDLKLSPAIDKILDATLYTGKRSRANIFRKTIANLNNEDRNSLVVDYKKAKIGDRSAKLLDIVVREEGNMIVEEMVNPQNDMCLMTPMAKNIPSECARWTGERVKEYPPQEMVIEFLDSDRQEMHRFIIWIDTEKNRIFLTVIYLNIVLAILAFVHSVRKRIGNRYKL